MVCEQTLLQCLKNPEKKVILHTLASTETNKQSIYISMYLYIFVVDIERSRDGYTVENMYLNEIYITLM